MLNLDISQYPTFHGLINSIEDSDNSFDLNNAKDNKDENEYS